MFCPAVIDEVKKTKIRSSLRCPRLALCGELWAEAISPILHKVAFLILSSLTQKGGLMNRVCFLNRNVIYTSVTSFRFFPQGRTGTTNKTRSLNAFILIPPNAPQYPFFTLRFCPQPYHAISEIH